MKYSLGLILLSVFLFYFEPVIKSEFTKGRTSLDTKSNRQDLNSKTCKSCHANEHEDWSLSRHKVSWTNPIFGEGFAVEKLITCIHCHAPLKEQAKQIYPNLNEIKIYTDSLVDEGVNCAVCHLRENKILTSKKDLDNSAHEFIYKPEISKSEFCANCHEFEFHFMRKNKLVYMKEKMQSTYSEWLNYKTKSTNPKTCQGCHMPEGKHIFPGAHSRQNLKDSISLNIENLNLGYKFILKTKEVGHDFPTGDLFRNITLEVKEGNEFKIIHTMGRSFKLIKTKDNFHDKVLDKNTSLKPFEDREVFYKSKNPIQYRLVYHYASEKDETRKKIKHEDLFFTIHFGELKKAEL